MARHKDAIIIGAGQAGPTLASRLAEAGKSVALIERGPLGGTCVNTGCTPTKTLVASARVAHMARRAADFGVTAAPVAVDMKAVKARKDKVVAASVKGLEDWLGGMDNVELIRGSARFTGPRQITVGDEVLTALQIFINAGARPVMPDWPGLADVLCFTSETVMDLDVLPEHLLIVGGGYIGLEFAQMYRRFGSRVTVVERGSRLVHREDEEVSDAIRDMLAGEGIEFVFGATDFAVFGTASAVRLSFAADGEKRTLEGTHLLAGIGRRPNTDDLDLHAAGIACDKRGFIKVNDKLETNVAGVYALGEINGRGAFTHTSYNDYEVVATNLLGDGGRKVTDRIPAYALYIDPPLGRAGMTEIQVRKSGQRAKIATFPMGRVQRAKERGETTGFMKILVSAETDLVLGASLFGIEGDEMIHAVIDIMAGGVTASTIARTMHIHPTVSEYLPVLMNNLKPLD